MEPSKSHANIELAVSPWEAVIPILSFYYGFNFCLGCKCVTSDCSLKCNGTQTRTCYNNVDCDDPDAVICPVDLVETYDCNKFVCGKESFLNYLEQPRLMIFYHL